MFYALVNNIRERFGFYPALPVHEEPGFEAVQLLP